MTNATVVVKELNGASATYTTVSSSVTSWMGCSDAYDSSPSNKIPIPSSGFSYSYWKSYSAEITANPSSNTLDNWCFYMTTNSDWAAGGNVGTAGGLLIGKTSGATYGVGLGSYDQAEGEANVDGRWNGLELTANHTAFSGGSVEAFPTSATQYDDSSKTSTGSTNFICAQLKVDDDATLGTIGAATLHIQYDES